MTAWKWIIVGSVALIVFFSSKTSRSYWRQKKYLKELEIKLNQMRNDNKNLAMELHKLKTDSRSVEQIARRELGLIQPGEIEYRFVVRTATPLKKNDPENNY